MLSVQITLNIAVCACNNGIMSKSFGKVAIVCAVDPPGMIVSGYGKFLSGDFPVSVFPFDLNRQAFSCR